MGKKNYNRKDGPGMWVIFKIFFFHLKNVVNNYFKAKPLYVYVFLKYIYKYTQIHMGLGAGENTLTLQVYSARTVIFLKNHYQ